MFTAMGIIMGILTYHSAAAAKSLQSCPTLCDPIDGSPPGSTVPEILQARTLEWVVISFSNAWKWSCSVMSDPQRPHGLQPSNFPGKSTGVGCHCLLRQWTLGIYQSVEFKQGRTAIRGAVKQQFDYRRKTRGGDCLKILENVLKKRDWPIMWKVTKDGSKQKSNYYIFQHT